MASGALSKVCARARTTVAMVQLVRAAVLAPKRAVQTHWAMELKRPLVTDGHAAGSWGVPTEGVPI
eukprot:scaffold391_cov223-Pinguiococcus_pyrenoidosus.AAC.12